MAVMPEPTFTIQEWLAARIVPTASNKPLRYAMWWMNRYLAPPHERLRYLDFDGGHLLFVTVDAIRYQVLAVNKLGGITVRCFLNGMIPIDQNFQMYREEDFTNWSNTWEGPLDDTMFVPFIPQERT